LLLFKFNKNKYIRSRENAFYECINENVGISFFRSAGTLCIVGIEYMPEIVSFVDNIETLTIRETKITELFESICIVGIEYIPEIVYFMENIKTLTIRHTKITELSESIGAYGIYQI
jgi:hypothetical protein